MKLNPIQQDGNKPAFKAQLILKNNIKFNQPHYKSLKSYVSNIGKKSSKDLSTKKGRTCSCT